MKTITSFGGPFIGLSRKDLARWSGVFGKDAVGLQSPFGSDYEAGCKLTGRTNLVFDSPGYFLGLSSEAFMIAPPIETALIVSDAQRVIVGQVEAAEEQWSFADIDERVIVESMFTGTHQLEIRRESAEYILFDSSIDGKSVKDYLYFNFEVGTYLASSAMYNHDNVADINLYMFSKLY